jgi:hypothetical protein
MLTTFRATAGRIAADNLCRCMCLQIYDLWQGSDPESSAGVFQKRNHLKPSHDACVIDVVVRVAQNDKKIPAVPRKQKGGESLSRDTRANISSKALHPENIKNS